MGTNNFFLDYFVIDLYRHNFDFSAQCLSGQAKLISWPSGSVT